MAHNIDLLIDQEMVTANTVPRVMPPRTVSFTVSEFAISELVSLKI
jgi:hypothetical protein